MRQLPPRQSQGAPALQRTWKWPDRTGNDEQLAWPDAITNPLSPPNATALNAGPAAQVQAGVRHAAGNEAEAGEQDSLHNAGTLSGLAAHLLYGFRKPLSA